MSDASAQQIEAGLAGAQRGWMAGDLEAVQAHLAATLDALAAVTAAGFVPRQQRTPIAWDGERARQLVLELLARLKAAGCHAFPYAGTLLGLERDGRLLANDKDADLAVWLEDFSLAVRLLQQLGLQRAGDVPPFANVASLVDARTGYSVDLFGVWRNPAARRIEGGAWLYGRPPSHQRVLHLPWFGLAERDTPAGAVWWPDPAAALLTSFYGDWRTPQPDWDTQVSNLALVERNLSWQCLALKSLVQCWLTGDLPRTARLLAQIAGRGGEDERLRRWRGALQP